MDQFHVAAHQKDELKSELRASREQLIPATAPTFESVLVTLTGVNITTLGQRNAFGFTIVAQRRRRRHLQLT